MDKFVRYISWSLYFVMHSMKFILCVLAISVLITRPVNAQWVQTNGPYGQRSIVAVSIAGSTMYAVADSAGISSMIYVSTNSGASWKQVSSFDAYRVDLFTSGNAVFVSSWKGIYRSITGGKYWTKIFDAQASSFASMGGSLFMTSGNGLVRSNDNGDTWSLLNAAIDRGLVVSGSTLYALRPYNGYYVMRSTDGGTTWTQLNNSPAGTLAAAGSKIYCNAPGGTVWFTNSDSTWRSSSLQYFYSMVNRGSKIFAQTSVGIYMSTDDGATWTALPQAPNGVLAANSSTLFVGGVGVSASTDDGASWKNLNAAPVLAEYNSVFTDGAFLFDGTEGGLFRSTDRGSTWHAVDSLFGSGYITNFALLDTTLYVSGYLSRSSDHGATWSAVNKGNSKFSVWELATLGHILFAATYDSGIFRSADNGGHWNLVYTISSPQQRILAFATIGSHILAWDENRHVIRSVDSGATWSQVGSLPGAEPVDLCTFGSILFATSQTNLYRSSDEGQTWNSVRSTNYWDYGTPKLVAIGQTLFDASAGDGVLLSTDSGKTWSSLNDGFESDTAKSLAVLGHDIYVGTQNGVWRRPWPKECIVTLNDTVDVSDVMVGGYVDASLKFITQRDSSVRLKSAIADSASVSILSPAFPRPAQFGDTVAVKFRVTPQHTTDYAGAITLSLDECQPVFPFRGRAVMDGEDSLKLFGDQSALLTLRADSIATSRTFYFQNTMPATIRVTDVHLTDTTHFRIDSVLPHAIPDTLTSGAYLAVAMTFDADTLGFYRDSLVIVTEGSAQAIAFNVQAIMAKTAGKPQQNVSEASASEAAFLLFPNPTRGDVAIGISNASHATVEVFDLLGNRVTSLSVMGTLAWDARMLPAGSYFVRASGVDAEGRSFVISKRLAVE